MHQRLLTAIALFTGTLAAVPIAAHHSVRGTYDDSALLTIAGTVASIEWRNPHAVFVLETTDAGDNAAAWSVEIGAPSALIKAGLNRDFLKQGDQVTLEIWAAKNGTMNAHARSITFADGRRIDVPEDMWMEAVK
jgi:hypothetical protein